MNVIRILVILLVAAAVVLIGPQYLNYRDTQDAIPAGVLLAGASIGGETAVETAANLRTVFESPILVTHGDRRIVLHPQEIGFEIDAETMAAEAQAYGRGWYGVRDFLLYVMERQPVENDVPLIYTYDRIKLGSWLQEQARKYDNDPTPAYAKLDTLIFVEGQPGRYANLNESAINILHAFTNSHNRHALLELNLKPALPPDFAMLEAALRQRLDKFPGIYSLYYQDLGTGTEIDIDGDTAFAGMSTVKLPILLKLYYDLEQPLGENLQRWINELVTSETASNAAANALMYHLGNGDTVAGARIVTDFSRQLGLENTFIGIPYDSNLRPPFIQTPANTNPEYNTFPDPAMQTTPADIGRILADIGYCAEGGGNLLAAYGESLTSSECQELITWMEQNPMGFLIKYGVPKDTRVAHKHGYGTDTQGDVALIYGPEGPYVLSIFVYQQGWVVWDFSNPLMNDLSRLIWNFYLYRQDEAQLPPLQYETEEASPGETT
ncbi:MAG: hypothetical protein GY759_08210 [Chloroflexi bacterium]|nr:hypothetical protein [Chloroflexota bacterium]